jgi:hypothetical protein
MGHNTASGLGPHDQQRARQMVVQACALLLAHPADVHYTMDRPAELAAQGGKPRRWDGINLGLRAWRGEYPHYGDCSSTFTWLVWQGLGHFGLADHVNGERWRGGYTGTLLDHGRPVHDVGKVKIGDALIYGPRGSDGEHVALGLGGGWVLSHGSEGGPYRLRWNYRGDLMAIRRYI